MGTIVPNIEEKLKTAKNQKCKEFLEKIGFIPNELLGEYKVEYKLYDLSIRIFQDPYVGFRDAKHIKK